MSRSSVLGAAGSPLRHTLGACLIASLWLSPGPRIGFSRLITPCAAYQISALAVRASLSLQFPCRVAAVAPRAMIEVVTIVARNGVAALALTPVLPEATSVGTLSAQSRRPRPWSATSAIRQLATFPLSQTRWTVSNAGRTRARESIVRLVDRVAVRSEFAKFQLDAIGKETSWQ